MGKLSYGLMYQNQNNTSVSFHASAHDHFEMMRDEKKHALFTGGSARVDRNVGGTFSTSDGYSTGTNLELVQDAIMQTWQAGDWQESHYSPLIITL